MRWFKKKDPYRWDIAELEMRLQISDWRLERWLREREIYHIIFGLMQEHLKPTIEGAEIVAYCCRLLEDHYLDELDRAAEFGKGLNSKGKKI